MKLVRWSTPIRGYRTYGAMRLSSGGVGRWHDAEGEYPYIDVTIDDVQYNVQPRLTRGSYHLKRPPITPFRNRR